MQSAPCHIALPNGTSFVLPLFGVLVLDSSGLLPSGGTSSKTFPGPTDPVWVGLSLYWQALLGTPLKLGNPERMTFTTL